MSWRRLRTLLVREARATLRDPFTVTTLVMVPIVALLTFGSVLSTDVTALDLVVLDADDSSDSRRLVGELTAGDTFSVRTVDTREELEHALVAGVASVGVLVPPGFGRDLERSRSRRGPPPEIQATYDGTEATLAGNAEAALGAVVAATGAVLTAGGRTAGAPGGVRVATEVLFNPRLDGVPFMVAGVFGFVLSFLTTLITAVSIVNERRAGTFEQLQVTPATAIEILLGKILPLGAVFSLDVALMMLISGVLLDTWPAGSALFFLVVSSLYILLSLALGLLISATSATAAEAVQKSVLLNIPVIMLSGFAYPIRSMPHAFQWFPELMPATHYIRFSRAVYLRGEGPLDVWPELLILTTLGAVLILAARRTLESRG